MVIILAPKIVDLIYRKAKTPTLTDREKEFIKKYSGRSDFLFAVIGSIIGGVYATSFLFIPLLYNYNYFPFPNLIKENDQVLFFLVDESSIQLVIIGPFLLGFIYVFLFIYSLSCLFFGKKGKLLFNYHYLKEKGQIVPTYTLAFLRTKTISIILAIGLVWFLLFNYILSPAKFNYLTTNSACSASRYEVNCWKYSDIKRIELIMGGKDVAGRTKQWSEDKWYYLIITQDDKKIKFPLLKNVPALSIMETKLGQKIEKKFLDMKSVDYLSQ